MSAIEMSARAAKSGVRAVHDALSRGLHGGQARVSDAVESTGRHADDSLDAVERAAIRVLDSIARQGTDYARTAKGRLYEVEGRLFPRRRTPAVATALVGLGVGLLLTKLFTAGAPKRPARGRIA